jgi:catechol 2,3-dioxygenase-like lactoylglutathione lyase family enzyme
MPLTSFDHVNLRTTRLPEMIAWYGAVLDMHPGKRPDFSFDGAWLYLGDRALIHLVAVAEARCYGRAATMEHFAFRATGMADFLETLGAQDIACSIDPVPGFPIVQVNFHDPDGNHIHVDFDAAENA